MKGNRVGLSIGYVTQQSHTDANGVTILDSVDLFEISIVPAPANADTKVLEWKSADCPPHLVGTSLDPQTADGAPVVGTPLRKGWDYDAEYDHLRGEFSRHMYELMRADPKTLASKSATKTDRGPLQVASFPVE